MPRLGIAGSIRKMHAAYEPFVRPRVVSAPDVDPYDDFRGGDLSEQQRDQHQRRSGHENGRMEKNLSSSCFRVFVAPC